MSIQLFRKNEAGEVESALFDPVSFEHNLGDGGYVLDPKELEEVGVKAPPVGELLGIAKVEEKPKAKRGRPDKKGK